MDKSFDRLSKYSDGIPRLFLIFIGSFLYNESSVQCLRYFTSYRWIGHCYIGAIGAIVNVNLLQSFRMNIFALMIAGVFILYDISTNDLSMLIYLLKTFCGDFIAGKLDTVEWKSVLAFAFIITIPYIIYKEFCLQYFRIFSVLFTLQFICEYGDNYLEHMIFFRHRYSYDVFAILLLLANHNGFITFAPYEMAIIQYDFLICLCYRISNYLAIVWNSPRHSNAVITETRATSIISASRELERQTMTTYFSTQLQMFLFYLLGTSMSCTHLWLFKLFITAIFWIIL